jgi:DNA-binding CsgD family transcriptional regulator
MTLSDARNKQIALARIKRLCSLGLPVEPLVRGLFDLIDDGVPHSPNRAFHVGDSRRISAYITSSPGMQELVPIQKHFFVDSEPRACGIAFRYDAYAFKTLLPSKTIWEQHEIALPNLYRAEGYNVVYRPLEWNHILQVVFEEGNEYLGYYPIWRSADQKPFGREDIQFLRAAAPHISHGLRTARLLSRESSDDVSAFAPLPGWGTGMILLDPCGRPIAMDATARLIFQQLGVFDGLRGDAFGSRPVQEALDYVARTLTSIFRDSASAPATLAPVCRVRLHWTGIAIRVRGVMMPSADGREYIAVLIERGETAEYRRQRMISRWGLSHREAEVLHYIAEGKTGPEIAILLGISHDTARKHTGSIFQKLGVETRTAAAALALEAGADGIS